MRARIPSDQDVADSESIHQRPDRVGEHEAEKITRLDHAVESDQSTVIILPSAQPDVSAVASPADPGNRETTGAVTFDSAQGKSAGPGSTVFDDLNACPRCGAKLSEDLKMGWCQRCGYCRYLERASWNAPKGEAPLPLSVQLWILWRVFLRRCVFIGWSGPVYFKRDNLLDAPVQTPASVPAATPFPVKNPEWVPEWLSVLMCGLFICVLGSLTAGLNLRDEPHARLVWCLAQAAVGIVALATGYTLAFLQVVPPGQRRQHKWRFLSPRLWFTACHRLPETRWAIWLSVWGLGLGAGAVLIHVLFARG